ncbi:unnamed protein product [Linum trigynum]|uniref:BED-type domain-containing protein n=1 Tax=Linum trigynum TaxID=586398 RepID=A0AAV2CKN6_9ROSI
MESPSKSTPHPFSLQEEIADNFDEINSRAEAIPSEAAWVAKKRKRSDIWDHYDVVFVEEGSPKKRVQKGKCKRCNSLIAADSQKNGTSALRKHDATCRKKFNDQGAPCTAKKKVTKQGGGGKPLDKGQTILKYFSPVSVVRL